MKHAFILLLGIVGLCAFHAKADILAAWDVAGTDVADLTGVDGDGFPYAKNASTTGLHVSGGQLGLGFDSPSSAADMYGFRFLSGMHTTSLADAIANNHYIQFTVVAQEGYRLNLASIEMNGESGTSGPGDIALLSDVAGFGAGNEIASLAGRQGVNGGWDTDASGWGNAIDLSGSEYQQRTSVTFRIYGWNSTGSSSSGIRNLSGNDLVVNGVAEAIPEPAVLGFIGLFGIGTLVARRFMG